MQTSVDRSVSLHFVPFRSVPFCSVLFGKKANPKSKAIHMNVLYTIEIRVRLYFYGHYHLLHIQQHVITISLLLLLLLPFFSISFSTVYKSVQIKANGLWGCKFTLLQQCCKGSGIMKSIYTNLNNRLNRIPVRAFCVCTFACLLACLHSRPPRMAKCRENGKYNTVTIHLIDPRPFQETNVYIYTTTNKNRGKRQTEKGEKKNTTPQQQQQQKQKEKGIQNMSVSNHKQ